jgi:hypothetical protein
MAGDYLGLIWEYTKNDISERLRNSEWGKAHALRVILTVPAVWSATAKSRTLQAARTAGLPNNITLVPEPEAAALAVLRDKDKMRGTEVIPHHTKFGVICIELILLRSLTTFL